MSNHLAVATVTAALRRALQLTLDAELPSLSARVATLRPNAPASELPSVGINLFLFQVVPNAALRNADLPTRRDNGSLLRRPSAALDLHYLLSFYGDEAQLEPQLLLACAVRALQTTPVLSTQAISDTLSDPTFSFLAGSDLADALDHVRFSPLGHSLEETAKIWSIFFQMPYVLSTAYMASPVQIDAQVAVQSALPVRTTGVYVVQSREPKIETVLSRASAAAPAVANQVILPGYILVLQGQNLQGDATSLEIDGAEVPTSSISNEQVSAALPASLRAGPHSLKIVQRIAMGQPPVPHAAQTSNVAAFVLSPTITASATASSVTVHFNPSVGKQQKLRLLLSQFDTPAGQAARTYGFEAASRNQPAAPAESASIDIPIVDVAPGTYLVRVQVDGAESPLAYNAAEGRYDAPKVDIP